MGFCGRKVEMMSIPKVTLHDGLLPYQNETQGEREKRREKVKTVRTGPGLCKALREEEEEGGKRWV